MKFLLAAGALTLLAGGSAAPAAPSYSVSLKPIATADGANIDRLVVDLAIDGAARSPTGPLLQMPLVITNVVTAAESVSELSASDAKGSLRLTSRENDKEGEGQRLGCEPEDFRVHSNKS